MSTFRDALVTTAGYTHINNIQRQEAIRRLASTSTDLLEQMK